MSNHNAVIILAAGQGTRMKSDLPKVMHLLYGQPLIRHVVDQVVASGVTRAPLIVVSPAHTLVQEVIGKEASYVVQQEQLGTGHAVAQAQGVLEGKADTVLVVYGDMPFLSAESIRRLAETHAREGNTMTVMTVHRDVITDSHSPLYAFGRIMRDSQGTISGIVELKDATPEQAALPEVNTGCFCFDAAWLWTHLAQLDTNNAQGEYYLTDVVGLAIREGATVGSVSIREDEAIGINSQEDLQQAQSRFL